MELIIDQHARYSVAQFPASYQGTLAAISGFKSLIWTAEECSVVALTNQLDVREATAVEEGWVLMQISGVLDFALTGILAQIANPLAAAGISLFALSTYNTDYVLVKAHDLEKSLAVLSQTHQLILS